MRVEGAALDAAAVATAAASATPAAAPQQPTVAAPESADADVAAERGTTLNKPLAKHTVKDLRAAGAPVHRGRQLPSSGKKQELVDRLIEAGY